MSARRFARDVPRAVQHAVRAAIELADDNGEVRGGMPALQKALGHDTERATRALVARAETWRLLRRKGDVNEHPRRVVVVGFSSLLGSIFPSADDATAEA